jgi:hypothetical protein
VSRAGLLFFVLLLLLVSSGCRGPRPVVEQVESRPAGDGRIQVVVTLRNAGGGEGQVALGVTVRERAGGVIRGRDERAVALRAHERLMVTLELPTAGARPADLVADAEATYPPG